MPDKIYLHKHKQFAELISIIGSEMGIDPYLVEKDYWIMHCLYGLQKAGYDFQLKGGTSLSKGYKIIDRFSEDIDIHITPPSSMDLKTGKNHNKPQHTNARKLYYDTLSQEIKIPDIQAIRDTSFDDKKYRSGGIRLNYNSSFPANEAAAKEGVLLEVGFDDVAPNTPIDISSWAWDFASQKGVDIIDNRATQVLCYEAGYTFVEKLQTISTKFRQYQAGKIFPVNFLRHYYDIYCLLKQTEVQSFLGTDNYEEHKLKRFPKEDLAIAINENQAFILADKDIFKLFEQEYKSKSPLYYNGQPDFNDIIELIRDNLSKL